MHRFYFKIIKDLGVFAKKLKKRNRIKYYYYCVNNFFKELGNPIVTCYYSVLLLIIEIAKSYQQVTSQNDLKSL